MFRILLQSGSPNSAIAIPAFYKIDKQRKLSSQFGRGIGSSGKTSECPDFDRSFSQLLDVTHVTGVELSAAEDVRTLARKTIFSPYSRRAILVTSDLKFGLARDV